GNSGNGFPLLRIANLALQGGSGEGYGSLPTDFRVVEGIKRREKVLFQYGENQEEAVMLRTYPFSLSREFKTWLNELDEETITSWTELREAFISRYFSPAKFRRLLNEIHIFHQLGNETLIEAWIRLKEMLRICYGHGLTKGTIVHIFYHGLNSPTQGILDAGGIFIYNIPNKAFKIRTSSFSNLISWRILKTPNLKPLFLPERAQKMRDGRRDNHASQNYMKDDMPMCEPHEENYV
nr:reverse transcriptase domain-containing protein [Tanacetum cinerariifolium]